MILGTSFSKSTTNAQRVWYRYVTQTTISKSFAMIFIFNQMDFKKKLMARSKILKKNILRMSVFHYNVTLPC